MIILNCLYTSVVDIEFTYTSVANSRLCKLSCADCGKFVADYI